MNAAPSVLPTIDPQVYATNADARALADRVIAHGGLNRSDVFEIVDLGDRYRVGLYVRDADGKIVIAELDGWVVDREPVRRYVEVALP